MRRTMLLTLLALALPTAMLADSERFEIQTGNFLSGSVSPAVGSMANAFAVGSLWTLNGNAGTIILTFTSISGNCAIAPTGTNTTSCNFTGTVTATGGGNSIMDSVFDGHLTRTANTPGPHTGQGSMFFNVSDLTASLVSQGGSIVPDSNLSMDGIRFCGFAGTHDAGCGHPSTGPIRAGTMTLGSGMVDVDGSTAVPEPGMLLPLGTGLIGLTEMVRRKLKLWT